MNTIKSLTLTSLLFLPWGARSEVAPVLSEPTPVNQVFQYVISGTYTTSISHEHHKATCYLCLYSTQPTIRGMVYSHDMVEIDIRDTGIKSWNTAGMWCTP